MQIYYNATNDEEPLARRFEFDCERCVVYQGKEYHVTNLVLKVKRHTGVHVKLDHYEPMINVKITDR